MIEGDWLLELKRSLSGNYKCGQMLLFTVCQAASLCVCVSHEMKAP